MKVTYAVTASGVLGGLAALLIYSVSHHHTTPVSHSNNITNTAQASKQNAPSSSSTNGTSSTSQSSTSNSSQTSNASSSQGQAGSSGNVTVSVGGPVAQKKQQALVSAVQTMLQGSTAKQMDASAFVQYAYAKIGVQLPRTIAEQAKLGSKVTNPNQLQKGDIVCFDLKNNSKNVVTFDGIYMGNQNFAAKTTHGLEIISLTDNYWGPRFLYGKRIL
ncbi:C40 family peptidase [Alicyclobacillus sp. SO9]|uniref:C40 family peptidase n=1 Tax=Alicyclobacillus sp. SO9 TaxID=2665646 RepID=UPI0018E74AE4|nr:NlpC/P60 family protein [Alicyclobacillus sp. SO9]QQE79298.1 C40 family peptidase [Alicyclobacillus sp. SO9]